MKKEIKQGYSFDDILLIPKKSFVLPKDTNIECNLMKKLNLSIPLISSAMDTVTEHNLAIAIGRIGGLGIIHKNFSIEDQLKEALKAKDFNYKNQNCIINNCVDNKVINNYFMENPQNEILILLENEFIKKYYLKEDWVNNFKSNKNFESSNSKIFIDENNSCSFALKIMDENKIDFLICLDKYNRFCGLIKKEDIFFKKNNLTLKELFSSKIKVGAAVGISKYERNRIIELVNNGIDVIVIDTAHGHSELVKEQLIWYKKNISTTPVIVGNIATADAANDLINAGADCLKVGIGPGSICTTRVVCGIGVPQFTAILSISNSINTKNIPLIADGGIRNSGDIIKAIGAGADCVMIGNLFAGSYESPGNIIEHGKKIYKNYRGMGSVPAMKLGSSERYFQNKNSDKFIAEGVEGMVECQGSLYSIIFQLVGGLRSGMGYIGAANIKEIKEKAEFIKISQASYEEGCVHNLYPFKN